MTTKPHDHRLQAFIGLPHKLGDTPVVERTGPLDAAAAELAEALVTALDEIAQDSGAWVTVRCEPAPDAGGRTAITSAFAAAFDDAGWQEIEDGWEGERVEFDRELQPGFAREDEWCEISVAGCWYDAATFLVTEFRLDDAPTGYASVSASHGHPDSRCSGSWCDTYAVIAPRLGVDHHHKDEDGYYVRFEAVDASTPASVADALDTAVYGWEIYGGQSQLLRAHFLGFDGGDVLLLEGLDNPGYCVEDVTVSADPIVLGELERRNAAPSCEEARAWLDAVRPHYADDSWPADDPLVQRLEAIAAGDSDADGGVE